MIDLSIIKLMMKKENLDKFGGIVYSIAVEPEIHKILISINKYYEEYINQSQGILHPTHRTPEEKKELIKKRRRRAKK